MLNLRRFAIRRPSASLVISMIALFVSLAGTATAAAYITGAQIKNGSITGADIKNKSITGSDIRRGSLYPAVFHGKLPAGPRGAKGATGAAGAPGSALAYAQVTAGTTPTVIAASTKGFARVTNIGVGNYCLTPAVSIATSAHPAVVSTQAAADEPGMAIGKYALWQADAAGCAVGDYKVRTYRVYTEAEGGVRLADDVSFSIIVA